jgi:alcohol dehydrogenase
LAAHDYPALLELVRSGAVRPDALVGREIGLADAPAALVELDRGRPTGMTVIRP